MTTAGVWQNGSLLTFNYNEKPYTICLKGFYRSHFIALYTHTLSKHRHPLAPCELEFLTNRMSVNFNSIAVNNKSVISRSCYWEDINAPRDACANANTPEYIRTEFCETCDTEGCNGAGQFAPIALLVAIPTVIAKILLF